MGSSLKRNYTAMGSTVNLASRLESLTKRLHERILISHDTLSQLSGELPIIDRGEEMVAGVARPVHVYAVVTEQEYAAAVRSRNSGVIHSRSIPCFGHRLEPGATAPRPDKSPRSRAPSVTWSSQPLAGGSKAAG